MSAEIRGREKAQPMQEHYLKQELYALMKSDDVLFEFLQAGSLDGIWYWDLETGTDEWLSPRFWSVLGYDPDEMRHLASEWMSIIFPEDLEHATDNFNKHCADPNHPYDQIVRYRHKNGSTVWVRCRGVAVRDDEGRPIRILGAHTDITSQMQAEQELKQANEALRKALDEIKTLRGIIPICGQCNKIRNEEGYWDRVEEYISKHTQALFSHGLCPDCYKHAIEEIMNIDNEAEPCP